MLTVTAPGPLTTVQDAGRPGWAHLGVPRSGALDLPALHRANTLVGNAPDAAALEVTLGGLTVVFDSPAVVALAGARCPLSVGGVPASHATAVGVPAGVELKLGPATAGVRGYLAVAGGFAVDAVLGSRSTDTLAGLGPNKLAAGDRLPTGGSVLPQWLTWDSEADLDIAGVWAGSAARLVREPAIPEEPVLRVHPGPRDDWFSPAALEALYQATWTVNRSSDRVGARLEGPELTRTVQAELRSEGMVAGALQVPKGSGPVLFLADHPVTGGYPVIAVVDPGDLWLAAQAAPGTALRFQPA